MTEEQEEAHAIRPLMNITLPCDRRLVDGALALASCAPPRAAADLGRLAQDNWAPSAMLSVKSVERWTILLDSRE